MFAQEIGIDLGTANTVVVTKKGGIVVKEPSIVAVDRRTREVIAVGAEARSMVGRTPDTIQSVKPLQGGVVSDMAHSTALLRHVIRKIAGSRWLRPRVVMTMHANASAVDRRALAEAAMQAGAGEVSLVEETVAAGLGAGLPVDKAVGSLLVDLGSGNVEVAVISLGSVVVSASSHYAGEYMDEAIAKQIKREHNMMIGAPTAERVKLELGSALPGRQGTTTVSGRLITTGLPATITVSAADVYEAVADGLAQVDLVIQSVLERTPPELLRDISETGITLTGGGALMPDLDKRIARATNLPVRVAESPLDAVAIGTKAVLEKKPRIQVLKLKS